MYKKAVETLADGDLTTLILVSRPEETPLKEAARASEELADLGVNNQILIMNGVLAFYDDAISERLYLKQQKALEEMPKGLQNLLTYTVPLRAYNVTGIENVRALLTQDHLIIHEERLLAQSIPQLKDVIEDLYNTRKKVIFTMGKGGVGKTTIAAAIALGLSARGKKSTSRPQILRPTLNL